MQLQNLLRGIEDYIIVNDIKPEDWELQDIDLQETEVYELHCKGEYVAEFPERNFAEAVRDMLIDRTYRTRQWSTINLTKAGDEAVAFLNENPTFLKMKSRENMYLPTIEELSRAICRNDGVDPDKEGLGCGHYIPKDTPYKMWEARKSTAKFILDYINAKVSNATMEM